MRRLYGSLLAVVLVSSAALAAPPDPVPIRLPVAPVVPSPMPPAPKAVSSLAADEWYVIDSDVSVLVLASPEGVVKLTEDAGPIKLRGKFVDGRGETETRTYKGKQVITVEAVTTGRVELLIVPTGATAAKDVIRVTLDVLGARPPPVDPKVDPVVPVPVPVTSFRVILVYDAMATLSATQTGILNSKAIGDYLTATTTKEGGWAGWRRKSSAATAEDETPGMRALWNAAQPKLTGLPCMLVEVNGKAEIIPFPASVDAGLATLKKYSGGK